MKNQKISFILICLIALVFSTQISATAKDNWKKVKTKNFTLIGNAKESKIRKVGIRLEQFRETIKRLVPALSKDSPTPTTVIVFKDSKSFRPFKPTNSKGKITEWVAGYFQAGFDIDYIALTFETKGVDPYQTIFHEYTHNLVDYNIGRKRLPTWYNEGLAEYYDQFSVSKDRIVRLGGKNSAHISLLKQNELIPLNRFLNIGYDSLRSMSQTDANLFYAQSWATMHFLLKSEDGKRKKQLDNFTNLILQKTDSKIAFEQAFQMNFSEFEARLEAYIKNSGLSADITKFDTKLTAGIDIQTSNLSQSQVEAVLGDLLYQRERFTEAKKHLINSLKLKPNLSLANSTLGLIYLREKDFAKADMHLNLATKASDADFLTFHRYAYFLSREVVTLDRYVSNYTDERAQVMRDLLNRSISLNPDYPESYRLQAFINLVRNEKFDEGIKFMKNALSISPNKEIYSVYLAQLYLRKKDLTNAGKTAEKVFKLTNDEFIKSRASDILSKIKMIESELANTKLTEVESKDNYSANGKKSLTDDELEKNREQTFAEAINEVLYKPKSDEKRIVGNITEVSCSANNLTIKVLAENEVKFFTRKSLKGLKLKTYTAEMMGGQFGCGEDTKNVLAVLIYKPNDNDATKNSGIVSSIEFVPRDFVLALDE